MAKRNENKDLRNFGLFLAALLAVFGGISFYKQGAAWPWLWGAAGFALLSGLFLKPAIKPVFRASMWLGMKINWVMTRVILTVFFVIFLTPMGIISRIIGADLLKRKADRAASSFWKPPKRTAYDPRQSERLF